VPAPTVFEGLILEMTPPAPESGPGLWPGAFGAWIKVAVIYQRGSRRFAAMLRPIELTVAQFDALANLYVEDGVTQNQLAERLLVTKGNVTGLMNRLSDHGLVQRSTDPVDRRANRIHLTAEGRSRAKQGLILQRRLIDEMMGGLDTGERQSLRDLLSRVVDRLEA
jgi:DNA-binding MarR family transcriptional regulator